MSGRQKAQGVVEFALVLPLLLLLFFGIVYFGFLFSDYLTMNNTVRSVAYDASLHTTDEEYRAAIRNNTQNVTLFSDVFIWTPDRQNGTNTDALSVVFDAGNQDVLVTANARFNRDNTLGNAMLNLLGADIGNGISITYRMFTTRTE